jgi:hypothetical protein
MIHEYSPITWPLRRVMRYELTEKGFVIEKLECGHNGQLRRNYPPIEYAKRRHFRRCWYCDQRNQKAK